MADTTIVGENVGVVQRSGPRTAFTWSVVIAGALAAWAISFILISLGSGIGLAVTSPYSGPNAGTMTVIGAIWLVFAQALAFATGGYMAARLRIRDHIPGPETRFRDAAHGFMAWVVGASLFGLAVLLSGAFAARTAADIAGPAAGGAAAGLTSKADNNDSSGPVAYYVDRLFRSAPGAQANQQANAAAAPIATTGAGGENRAAPNGMSTEQRMEASRIVLAGIRDGGLNDADRDYLAQLVAARTGMPQEETARRVTEVQNQAAQAVREAAETARKAGAYLSFWSFMALLFGAVAATLAGILGGELRDDYVKG
ncbi:MAG: hypothetical protein ACK4UO_07695 [Pseudolabrys sp.]